MLLCKPAATSHSMHNLEMFTEEVLLYMSCSIHLYPWLHLWPTVACCNLALKLLNNVVVILLTFSSMLPCLLLVIHAPYELVLAMLSFINMSYYCCSTCLSMYCSMVSSTSSPTCLFIVVPAMYCYSESVISLAMFAWMLPSFLLIFGISSVREFCSLSLVLAFRAFVCHVKSL